MAGLISPTEINVAGEGYSSSLERNQDNTDGKWKMPLWADNTVVAVFHLKSICLQQIFTQSQQVST